MGAFLFDYFSAFNIFEISYRVGFQFIGCVFVADNQGMLMHLQDADRATCGLCCLQLRGELPGLYWLRQQESSLLRRP